MKYFEIIVRDATYQGRGLVVSVYAVGKNGVSVHRMWPTVRKSDRRRRAVARCLAELLGDDLALLAKVDELFGPTE